MDDVSEPMTSASPIHVPDDHVGHDRQLVVAFACGDLPNEDLADARALVRRCRRCAALVEEILLISAATGTVLTAPPRPRDFRLTSDEADRLRGNVLSRLLRRLGSPRLRVLQPLAGAAMAIGILLLATTAVLPGFFAASGAAPAASFVGSAIGDDTARDASGGEIGAGAEMAPPSPLPLASPQAAASADVTTLSETDTSTKVNVMESSATETSADPVVPIALGLLVIGAVVLLVLVIARRTSRDPLLR
jgi:hypothetical protein